MARHPDRQMWTGTVAPPPDDALKPKPCRCEIPAMDTDEDGDRRCVKCGRAEGDE